MALKVSESDEYVNSSGRIFNFSTAGSISGVFKSTCSDYRISITLSAALFVICTFVIVLAQTTANSSSPYEMPSGGSYVTARFTDVSDSLSAAADDASTAASRQAINILIGAMILVAALAVCVVMYLNNRIVKTTRKAKNLITKKQIDLRKTKVLQDRFLTSATHELNTPLTVTTALTDVLVKNREGNLNERQLTQLAAVQRNNRHLQAMVDLMIQTSVAGENRNMEIETIQYSDFMKTALETIKEELEPQGIAVEWAVAPSVDRVSIDSDGVAKAVTNLVLNAGQYSPEGAIVFVSTERTNGHIKTFVRDFGSGISQADRAHVFSPFYRGDTERSRRVRGAGLGLTLVQKIIESQGGKVGFRNNDDEPGTTFCFTLPVVS